MEYRVLGPVEVEAAGGQKLALGGAMQQSVLASLLLRRGQTVGLERLVDDLWDEPPETAARTIQSYVSRLRHELPEGAIQSHPGGYRLVLDGAELDLERFEQRAEEGHTALAAGDYERAAGVLREALDLWHGPALVGLNSEALRREAQRLEELRLSVLEDRFEADLGRGRHGELVAELTAVVDEHPFRERPRAQLMRALYYSGRPGDALALYRDGRRLLMEELGLEPGQALRELEQAILRQDAQLEAPGRERSTPAVPLSVAPVLRIERRPSREVRKTVTVLFCDVVDSTGQGESTDPEVVRSRLARFFEQMKMIVERHGGTVEKFIGDAVMAVFGVPRAHEDDALRACRAAIEMQEALPSLGIEGRVGLTTGEVVTGTEERLATGDAVNVAARLEQAAGPGEVLIGEPTLELVRGAEVDELEPLELKGKTHPVRAYRLKAVRDPGARPIETRFVGREQELAAIGTAWERSLADQSCHLLTVVGEAGIGKSRLVSEALASLDALIVHGRCRPYGEGITYWPVVEVIKQLETSPADPVAASAIASLLGETKSGPTSAEEIASAFRKLLEATAPLIVVFDDIQWGEETFLDLVEHVELLSTGSPILLLCIARPELAERGRRWPVSLSLEPLPDAAIDELIGGRVAADVHERITRAAGGNPLFVAEMLTMAQQTAGEVKVPPTLKLLLAARLDQLDTTERRVLERAAVEGEIFHRGAVRALGPDEEQVTPQLASLVRKGLIRPEKSQFQGEEGFRFRHLLLRDAAYDSMPKAKRAELHERYAAWLEGRGVGRPELDEILGYHLEQSYRYRAELGPIDDEARALGERSARRFAEAGRRAARLGDVSAASGLLRRASDLLPADHPGRAPIVVRLGEALVDSGRSAEALHVLDELETQDDIDEISSARADVCRGELELGIAPTRETVDRVRSTTGRAIDLFAAHDEEEALVRACWLLYLTSMLLCRSGTAREAIDRLISVSDRFADTHPSRLPGMLAMNLAWGPTPVPEALGETESILLRVRDDPAAEPRALGAHAYLLAQDGAIGPARQALARMREICEREGQRLVLWSAWGQNAGRVELLAGDPAQAERALRPAYEGLVQARQLVFSCTAAGHLAHALVDLGRPAEAAKYAAATRDAVGEADVHSQILWRSALARALVLQGEEERPVTLAAEAVRLAETTEFPNLLADTLLDQARVLRVLGRPADDILERADVIYDSKGNRAGRAKAAALASARDVSALSQTKEGSR
ncbi:MAG: BTAD domain-containing putative transcriptional regulator [Gaiellaceae bacterium]